MRILPLFTLAMVLLFPCVTSAQMHAFEDSFGRVINAALVSHTGADADVVKIKKADGKEFDAKISIFSKKDQDKIRAWMKATPATINYAFRIEAIKQKTGTTAATAYDLKVTNLARVPVEGITVKTRSVYDSYYVPSSENFYGYGGRLVAYEETFKIGAEMKFNQTAKFSTTDRYSLLGIFVQVYNAQGKVVGEKKLGSTKMRSLNWADGKKRSASSSSSFRPDDDGRGGSSTITID